MTARPVLPTTSANVDVPSKARESTLALRAAIVTVYHSWETGQDCPIKMMPLLYLQANVTLSNTRLNPAVGNTDCRIRDVCAWEDETRVMVNVILDLCTGQDRCHCQGGARQGASLDFLLLCAVSMSIVCV
jgi:hypothetical protein